MTLRDRFVTCAAALAVGLVGLGGASASPAFHPPGGRASATPFELTLSGTLDLPEAVGDVVPGYTSEGTFESTAPFCARGTFVDVDPVRLDPNLRATRRFTCDDGTGSLIVSTASLAAELERQEPGIWRILEGTGSYADLRGDGYQRGSVLGGNIHDFLVRAFEGVGGTVTWRSSLHGYVDRDVVAPKIAVSRATATKLPRPAGAYAIWVAVALRDDVEGNAVSYTLRVTTARGVELARTVGRATNRTLPLTLRIRQRRANAVLLLLDVEDPNGNASSLRRSLKLPR